MSMHHLGKESTLARAYLLMSQSGVTCLPVYENSHVIGIISAQDIERLMASKESKAPALVGNYMKAPIKEVETPEIQMDLKLLARTLLERDDAQAIVLVENGESKGIYLKEDLLRLCTPTGL